MFFKTALVFFLVCSLLAFLIVSLDSNPHQQQQQTCASDTILFCFLFEVNAAFSKNPLLLVVYYFKLSPSHWLLPRQIIQ